MRTTLIRGPRPPMPTQEDPLRQHLSNNLLDHHTHIPLPHTDHMCSSLGDGTLTFFYCFINTKG